jgi:hypothetical protein
MTKLEALLIECLETTSALKFLVIFGLLGEKA